MGQVGQQIWVDHVGHVTRWPRVVRGLGWPASWVGLGWVGNGSKICLFSGLGWVSGLQTCRCLHCYDVH